MLLKMALFAAALANTSLPNAVPAPPPPPLVMHEEWDEEEFSPIRANCPVPKPRQNEQLVLLGVYEGSAVADHAVAGLDELTTTGAITVGPGSGRIFLVLTSYESMIYRISGNIERISQVVILHPKGGGITGVEAARVSFGIGTNCDMGYRSAGDPEGAKLAELMFGKLPDTTSDVYELHEWILGARDAGTAIPPPDHDYDPKASPLEQELDRFFPGRVVQIDPKSLVSSRTAERYRVLPSTAGAVQLERSRMIVLASAVEMEAWKEKAAQRYGRQAVGSISTYQAYRVVKPIEIPVGLCGAHSLTFLVPSEEYLRGDPCHGDILTTDGRVLKADMQAQLRLIEMKSSPAEASKLDPNSPASAVPARPSISPASPAKLPEQEARIQSILRLAVEKISPTRSCDLPELRQSDLLAVIGAYQGETVPTVTVAGQDEESSLADVVVGKGANPVYLVLSSYDPVIWRITGDVGRVRQLTVFYHKGAGVIGIPTEKIQFSDDEKCRIPEDVYTGRQLEDDVAVLAIFGRRANVIGGDYSLYRATLDDDTLNVDRVAKKPSEDRVLTNQPADPNFPKGKGNGPSTLEKDFHLRFPAGIASIDPSSVVATGSVERYEVLPMTAGAYQLEQDGALVPATAADVRRWKDRAIIGGHVRADRIKSLHFYSAYRVTRPIRIPSGLCGGYSLTFFVPSRDYLKGDPCHSNIYVDDGTIMAGS